jgi:hypothetical protein
MQPEIYQIEAFALAGCYAAYVSSFFTILSGQPIGPIFWDQAVKGKTTTNIYVRCKTTQEDENAVYTTAKTSNLERRIIQEKKKRKTDS